MLNTIFFDYYWMKLAFLEAEKGGNIGEVPVGSLLLFKNNLISSGFNRCIMDNNPCAHAEITAIKNAGKYLKNYRLNNTVLYVTHEPCLMCSSAIINARISRVIFGSYNKKYMGLTDLLFYLNKKKIKHHIKNITGGIQLLHCNNLIKFFFQKKRHNF